MGTAIRIGIVVAVFLFAVVLVRAQDNISFNPNVYQDAAHNAGNNHPGYQDVAPEETITSTKPSSVQGAQVAAANDSAPQVIYELPPNGVHIVEEGETLSILAQRYFGNIDLWPKLWALNPHVTNPHWIYPGTEVYLSGMVGSAAVTSASPEVAVSATTKPVHIDKGWMPIVLRDEGYLDPDALKKNGVIVASREDHMLLMLYDQVYLKFKKDVPAPGTLLTIYRKINKVERYKSEKGNLVRILGTVKLDRYDKKSKLGVGTLVELFEPVERGYSLAPIVRRIPNVIPKPSKKNLKARVIASIQPRKLLAQYQLVFVNVGRKQGVELGNRFEFLMSGDQWRDGMAGVKHTVGDLAPLPDEPKKYPDEIISEGYAVDVQSETSTILITHAERTMEYGNRAQMVAGK